ncbi:MAG: SDR family NAD(P)-dependent oxidoreductase [Chloroflexota bacterium]
MTSENQKPVEHPLAPLSKAVVVGASSGIGEAIARKLAKEGYQVALLARRTERLVKVAEEINGLAGEPLAFFYEHDVRDFDQIKPIFQTVLKEFKTIDLLVYNSGIMNSVGISEFDAAKDHEMIDVNLKGAISWLSEAAVLFEQMGKGKIVGISSVAGDRGRVANPGYNTSKAGFSTYLEALRNRLSRKGIHVLTVKPGYVDTDLLPADLGPFPAAAPEKIAKDVWRAIKRRKQVIYTPWWWRYILLIVEHIPSFVFRRMSF